MARRILFIISSITIALVLNGVLPGCSQHAALDSGAPRIGKEELRSRLDHPDVVIVDVRLEEEWKRSDWKIKGAVRENPEKGVDPEKYSKEKTIVLY